MHIDERRSYPVTTHRWGALVGAATLSAALHACPAGTSLFQPARARDAGIDLAAPQGDLAALDLPVAVEVGHPADTPTTPIDTPSTPIDTPSTPTDTPSAPMDTPITPADTGYDAPVELPVAADVVLTDCPGGVNLRCRGVCVNQQDDPGNCGACDLACPAGVACVHGACAPDCIPGLTRCALSCAFTQTDPANCGACGAVCDSSLVCSNSGCEPACTEGFSTCRVTGTDGVTREACANLGADPLNCGACGNVCRGGSGCVSGTCSS